MCHSFDLIVQSLASTNWASLLQGIGAIWVAAVGTWALTAWRAQLRAQKQVDFIDAITDTAHTFILLMENPVGQVTFAKIGIESYRGIALNYNQYENAEAIAFIENKGPDYAKRIWEQLNAVRPALSKMQSLATKGQVFGFKGYDRCFNACTMLAWSYNQIDAFCAIIGNANLNWENDVVQKSLSNLHKIDPENIRKNLIEQNKELIAFAKAAYEHALH